MKDKDKDKDRLIKINIFFEMKGILLILIISACCIRVSEAVLGVDMS